MFERRPLLGLLLALNLCVLIWRISVQEPAMFEPAPYNAYAGGGGSPQPVLPPPSGNAPEEQTEWDAPVAVLQQPELNDFVNFYERQQQQQQQQQQQHNQQQQQHRQLIQQYAGKHLLSDGSQSVSENGINGTQSTANRHRNQRRRIRKIAASSHMPPSQTSGNNNNYNNNYNNKPNNNYYYSIKKKTLVLSTSTHKKPHATTLPLQPSITLGSNAKTSPQLPAEDATQLIDLHDFRYLMVQPACDGHVEALIMIHSAPRNYEKRALIRETWGSACVAQSPIRIIFLLGMVNDMSLQQQLQLEHGSHGDMVQGTFVDDYRNMTYKHVMALKWFLYNCAQAQLLIKVDDDVFVNTPQLLKYWQQSKGHTSGSASSTIRSTTAAIGNGDANEEFVVANGSFVVMPPLWDAGSVLFRWPRNLLFCQRNVGAKVKRSYRSKWRVGFKEYSGTYYPPYCPGYAIVYSADVVYRLYCAAQRQSYFWIDDVHITGVLAQRININITDSLRYVLGKERCEQLLSGSTHLSQVEFLFAWDSLVPQQIRALWRLLAYANVSGDGNYPPWPSYATNNDDWANQVAVEAS